MIKKSKHRYDYITEKREFPAIEIDENGKTLCRDFYTKYSFFRYADKAFKRGSLTDEHVINSTFYFYTRVFFLNVSIEILENTEHGQLISYKKYRDDVLKISELLDVIVNEKGKTIRDLLYNIRNDIAHYSKDTFLYDIYNEFNYVLKLSETSKIIKLMDNIYRKIIESDNIDWSNKK